MEDNKKSNDNFHSEQINEIMSALSKAQGQISAASKDSSNPFFNSKYADLNSVWNACRDPLSANGLAVVQTMNKFDDEMMLVTTLAHSSGQWIRSSLPLRVELPKEGETDKFGKPRKANHLQLLGSCITYLRRYALASIVGVAPDEDDGNEAGGYYTPPNTPRNTPPNKQQQTQNVIQKQPSPKINEEQIKNLNFYLDECDDVFKADFINKLEKYIKGYKDFNDISVSTYEAAITAIKKHLYGDDNQEVVSA